MKLYSRSFFMIFLIFLYSDCFISLYLCILEVQLSCPLFLPFYFPPKKSLTLVILLAPISCWKLKKFGGKHACLLTDSDFNSWPQILPGYSVLLDYLYTFTYICFSKIRLYHIFCITSNFRSLIQDAKHPLCTHFLTLSIIRDSTGLLPPNWGRRRLLSNGVPQLFSWNIPYFH